MKIAFIHNDKKIGTGAHYINDLMSLKLKNCGVEIKNFYPRSSLFETPVHLLGIQNILFFYSLLERRKEILKFNIIQGTTYTPLPFLAYPVPVVSHFGSTTRGFLENTPQAKDLEHATKKIWYKLKEDGVINELNIKTRRPLRDIGDIEEYVASRAAAVIAASSKIRDELLASGIKKEKIHLIHNAIEDYWFEERKALFVEAPSLVFLGRLGSDSFTLKLKGVDRLIHLYKSFPKIQKYSFCISTNKKLTQWLRSSLPLHTVSANTAKDRLPKQLQALRGSILFIPSRYEGFSLSLIEGMSQGLVPIMYDVGVAREVIINGKNGFIVSSQKEAVDRVKELIANRGLRKEMSDNAIKSSKNFSSDIISQKLLNLYQTISGVSKPLIPIKKSYIRSMEEFIKVKIRHI